MNAADNTIFIHRDFKVKNHYLSLPAEKKWAYKSKQLLQNCEFFLFVQNPGVFTVFKYIKRPSERSEGLFPSSLTNMTTHDGRCSIIFIPQLPVYILYRLFLLVPAQ